MTSEHSHGKTHVAAVAQVQRAEQSDGTFSRITIFPESSYITLQCYHCSILYVYVPVDTIAHVSVQMGTLKEGERGIKKGDVIRRVFTPKPTVS